jgi:NitT/TauT family transport system substrate-binding protein
MLMKHIRSTDDVRLTRRDFLKVASGLGLSAAGMTLLEACGIKPATPIPEDAPLETTTIRLGKIPSLCFAAQYLAEDFLKREGFTDVQYNPNNVTVGAPVLSSDIDMSMHFVAPTIIGIDAGEPIKILSGVHVGCFEIFGGDRVKTIHDLKGKTIPISEFGNSPYVFLTTILTYVNIDPATEINWLTGQKSADMPQLLADGKVDAVIAFPPVAQEMHAKKIGKVVLNSMMDTPWSQYFCCAVYSSRDFIEQNPVATKRALRAILQAADSVALDPERAAKFMVDKGYAKNYDYALEAMKNIPHNRWREYDPEDTVIFYANQLRDAGLIKSNANDIVAKGTDWHFLKEIKVELKG